MGDLAAPSLVPFLAHLAGGNGTARTKGLGYRIEGHLAKADPGVSRAVAGSFYDRSMAILVDTPRWPAHGRLWAHLVSDDNLAELHAFARAQSLPERSFDLDHYDVPEEVIERLIAAGARPVTARELVVALRDSGLRVRGRDRR